MVNYQSVVSLQLVVDTQWQKVWLVSLEMQAFFHLRT